jgi:hypothetical protein
MVTGLMKKIVINTCHGGFCLSHSAFLRLRELGQREALEEQDLAAYWPSASRPSEPSLNRFGAEIPRDDRLLVRVVEELGAGANGHCATLKIVEIPGDVHWQIQNSHGVERVSEVHREWS